MSSVDLDPMPDDLVARDVSHHTSRAGHLVHRIGPPARCVQTGAWIKLKLDEAMRLARSNERLDGRIEMDDA